jgi:hypothetical protein
MKKPTGIDWQHTTFAVGQHADHLPATRPRQLFKRPCGNCGADTYTEIEYPADVPLLCNVCAASVAAQLESDASTLFLSDMPIDVKARLIDIAHQQRRSVEEVYKGFLAWKLGRPTKAPLYRKAAQKRKK